MRSFASLLISSLVIAGAGFAGLLVTRREPHLSRAVLASFCLAALWAACLVISLVRFRKRGLWLLVGAPFALSGPTAWTIVWWSCEVMHSDCL